MAAFIGVLRRAVIARRAGGGGARLDSLRRWA
jgi:hypothetical protein